MGSVNKVILVGNLGKDPEVRFIQSGQPVANFTMATTESWKDKSGGQQEKTEWHRIVVWGKLAELCGQFLKKGRQAYVEGRLQTREWTDKEGGKRQTTEIVASEVVFLGGRGEGGGGGGGGGGGYGGGGGGGGRGRNAPADGGGGGGDQPDYGEPPPGSGGDDIPF